MTGLAFVELTDVFVAADGVSQHLMYAAEPPPSRMALCLGGRKMYS